ncbi:MAG: DUF5666 domain-containing protein [Acidobacteriota bacterium]
MKPISGVLVKFALRVGAIIAISLLTYSPATIVKAAGNMQDGNGSGSESIAAKQELTISAIIQQADLANGKIKLFNRDITVDANTRVFNKRNHETAFTALKAGQRVVAQVENRAGELVAVRVSQVKRDFALGLSGIITAREENIIKLADSFAIDVTNVLASQAIDNLAVGMEVNIGLRDDAASGDILLSAQTGALIVTTRLVGMLQSVNASAQTISVLNQTVTLNNRTQIFIFGATKGSTIQQLQVGTSVSVSAVLTNNGLLARVVFQKQ